MKHHSAIPFNPRSALRAVFADALAHPPTRRSFHDYFVTHLPSSSLSPDKPTPGPQHHKLPRDESSPHSIPRSDNTRPATLPPQGPAARDTTIVRIPIKSAKHHFGAGVSRGSRPYNEDTYQAGTIALPAFAKKQPMSLSRKGGGAVQQGAKSESGDPQVFYFGVFDGHGGTECSEFLRERLHGYLEEAALLFGMESSLREGADGDDWEVDSAGGVMGAQDAEDLQKSLVEQWKETVGGYFKRFRPEYFPAVSPRRGDGEEDGAVTANNSSIETVLEYAFLKADLDFTTAQASKHTTEKPPNQSSVDDPVLSDKPLNEDDVLYHPDRPASQNLRTPPSSTTTRPSLTPDLSAPIGGPTRFKGGSTASIALISTPTPTPFWHPASPSTLLTAHVGDTRILLARSDNGTARPLTPTHHPSTPTEATRLRRYAATFTTDSFGEERVLGLANTRAFGDVGSKRIGVSAEPALTLLHCAPAEYAFLVLVSDGVSAHLPDQEIVDVVKEARTPEQAARDVVAFATETAPGADGAGADNATCLVVRMGGWERRAEGGGGSLGTREMRAFRKREASDPRRARQ